ncbi:MAG: DUF1343 domain-containing protein [Limisphaera sp.]|nr:DUF1343 domain-containing protein [Limisphaera sp.]
MAQDGAEAVFFSEKLRQIDEAIETAIREGRIPGGVLWLERAGRQYVRAYGQRALEPAREAMTVDTIFDVASLTKVVATTPAVMLLIEDGRLALDEPVARYWPEFAGGGREEITIRHLLTHTSGLRPGLPLQPEWSGAPTALAMITREKPLAPPGTAFVYSDLNFMILGELVRRISGQGLDVFCRERLFRPLGMVDTGFCPPAEVWSRVAPTERLPSGQVLRGTVHDPTARRMGGVAGHAGLFSTAADLARFARMLLDQGQLDGRRIFRVETVRLMTTVQTPGTVPARRGLGWDIDSPYSVPRGRWFPLGSYGHTGWTGPSLWIDPFSGTFVLFLCNRNHPTEQGSVRDLRYELGTLAAEAVVGFNFAHVPGALPRREAGVPMRTRASRAGTEPVLNGIDVLAREGFAPLRGKRVGLITNHSGHDRNRVLTAVLLKAAPEVQLVRLFSPEHGLQGGRDGPVPDEIDPVTGLPVVSLYGPNRRPRREHLIDLDALVFDVQDIGSRFYTYAATLGLAMEAAAELGKEVVVLDRVNPITGRHEEGPLLGAAPTFVGFYDVPIRHGLTVGELAELYRHEHGLPVPLTVVRCRNWRRSQWFDETGLPWTNPSPNMRSLTAALLYPGLGLLEQAVSVGRGTDRPFEWIGAPYIEDVRLAEELNAAGLPGIRFVPVEFTPTASVHAGERCRGVACVVTDREAVRPVLVGLTVASLLARWYPEQFPVARLEPLLLHPPTLAAVRRGASPEEIRSLWQPELDRFRQRRQFSLLYD